MLERAQWVGQVEPADASFPRLLRDRSEKALNDIPRDHAHPLQGLVKRRVPFRGPREHERLTSSIDAAGKTFFGMELDLERGYMAPDPTKAQALKNTKIPNTRKQIPQRDTFFHKTQPPPTQNRPQCTITSHPCA